jgi:hypothetical protein
LCEMPQSQQGAKGRLGTLTRFLFSHIPE